jgi:hypothetical protein
MSIVEQAEIQSKIAQIIERSRHHEEQFLVDSKTAALNIMRFLKNKNLLDIYYEENDY